MRRRLGYAFLMALLMVGGVMAGEVVKVLTIQPNMPEIRDYYARIVKEFEEQNPDVTVRFEVLDDTALKSKLPTLLQSRERPNAFFTWSGGVFHEQARVGALEDISSLMDDETRARYSRIGLDGMTYEGKVYGVPIYAASVMMWYNRELLDKGGVDPDSIKTWDDFLSAVETLKAAGVTPIVVGGKDKWPLHFYYGYLATRIAGTDGLAAAERGENGGLNNPDFVRAGREFKRLVDLEPFQPGFMDTGNGKAVGMFGDGRGAFFLMGNYVVAAQATSSSDGKGLGDNLGCIPFPTVSGGKGDPGDTFGGINGFLVTKGSSPTVVRFLTYLTNEANQLESGRRAFWLPIGANSERDIVDPRLKYVAELLGKAPHHQLYLDQALGASVGAAINDAAAALATGHMTPEEAAETIEEVREMQ